MNQKNQKPGKSQTFFMSAETPTEYRKTQNFQGVVQAEFSAEQESVHVSSE